MTDPRLGDEIHCAQLSENSRVQRELKIRRKTLVFSHFRRQTVINPATPHLFAASHNARHYTSQNRLSKGIFLATARFATRKLHPLVRCITAPLPLSDKLRLVP